MVCPYAVRTIITASGERMPVLLDRATGIPLFDPTVYVLTEIRSRNGSTATLDAHLRAILAFQLFVDARGVDLPERMREGRLLDVAEIDALASFCRLRLDDYLTRLNAERASRSTRVTSLEAVRQRMRETASVEVNSVTASSRLRAIRDYIDWLTKRTLAKIAPLLPQHLALSEAKERTRAALTARAPRMRGRNVVGAREGMAPNEKARLLQVISPLSTENPWRSDLARFRNELAIHLLLGLGLRRGELLGLKIRDFDFQRETVLIARRADDPDDPLAHQPKTKTMSRVVTLEHHQCARIQHYILNVRGAIRGARKHEFLFVAERTGAPMSLDALNKTFRVLREKVPGLPDGFSPHVLRHTWNDAFSELCDKAGIEPADEANMRKYAMGWSRSSTAAETYLRRHTREKANAVMREMQARLFEGGNEIKERDDE